MSNPQFAFAIALRGALFEIRGLNREALADFNAALAIDPTLPIAQYPAIAPPVVTVTVPYIGASPQAVETGVTIPLEQAVNGVQGWRFTGSDFRHNS